jgi:hypothetical protein
MESVMKLKLIATALVLSVTASHAETFTVDDPALSIVEMKSAIVGHTWIGGADGSGYKEFVDPNGELRGVSNKDGKYTAHWKFRDDGLFCFDYGAPNLNGCVQLIMKGNQVAFRRLDELIEAQVELKAGNPFGL